MHTWIVGPVKDDKEALEWVSSGKEAVFTLQATTDNEFRTAPKTEFELPADLAPGQYGVVQEVQTAASNHKSVTFMKVVK